MYRVLVVDDEKIEREGIKFLLSREEGEFEISEASNGCQALEILRNEEIDLLLTEILKCLIWMDWNWQRRQKRKKRSCRL